VRIVNRAEVKERLFSAGIAAAGSSPKELETLVRNELVKWGKVIKDTGIRAD
jgi:tripartite-type tricarboxylate transporter receptor subunit TctC